MEMFYQNTISKSTSISWINSIIKLNLEVHLIGWKHYCNMIQEVNPDDSKNESQLHQDLVHEVGTLQRHDKDIPHEPSKWFANDITEFADLNTNSLTKWIALAKKVYNLLVEKCDKISSRDLLNSFPSKSLQGTII